MHQTGRWEEVETPERNTETPPMLKDGNHDPPQPLPVCANRSTDLTTDKTPAAHRVPLTVQGRGANISLCTVAYRVGVCTETFTAPPPPLTFDSIPVFVIKYLTQNFFCFFCFKRFGCGRGAQTKRNYFAFYFDCVVVLVVLQVRELFVCSEGCYLAENHPVLKLDGTVRTHARSMWVTRPK